LSPAIHSPGLLITLLAFVLVLGPLVFIHEMGHYLVGRWFGVKADSFSIGFGKEVAGWTDKRGTRWRLSALPLGGYVQFAGDMNPASVPSPEWLSLPAEERERTFQAKPVWQRALIVLAGPLTNLLLAVLILAGFSLAYGKIVVPPVVGYVEPGSAAAKAGIQPGDRVVSIRGASVSSFLDVSLAIKLHPGEPLALVVERGGKALPLAAVASVREDPDRFGNKERLGFLGIRPAGAKLEKVGPVAAIGDALDQTRTVIGVEVTAITQILTGTRDVKSLGGPIKIAKTSGDQFVSGWASFVFFIAMISINLGFINLLPIPVLDGGHLAFYAIEAVRRKPVSPSGQEWAFRTGFALVVALMLFVTFNDVASLRVFGG
jgi:regulator of sigma E protease